MGTKSKIASNRLTHTGRILESQLIADLDSHTTTNNSNQLNELRDILDCFEHALVKKTLKEQEFAS